MSYVDGFVLAVPNANKSRYQQHAEYCADIFREYGMEKLVECWGDDIPEGEVTSFPLAVKLQPDETVVFSWMIWPSKTVRDTAWKKIMEDPRLNPEQFEMPFDGKRMIYGGFTLLVDR